MINGALVLNLLLLLQLQLLYIFEGENLYMESLPNKQFLV